MVVLLLEQVNHKQVVAKYLHLFAYLLALAVLLLERAIDATSLAITKASWGHGAGDGWRCIFGAYLVKVSVEVFLKVLWLRRKRLKRNGLLGVVGLNLTPKDERVGDLAPVRTVRANP